MSSLRPLPYFVLSGLCVLHATCQCVPVSCTLYWLSSWAFTSFSFRCLRVEIVSCIFCILRRDMKLCKFSNFKSLKSKILFPLCLSKLMLSEVCYNCCITLPSLVITKISDLYLMLMLYFFPFAFVPRLIFYEFIYTDFIRGFIWSFTLSNKWFFSETIFQISNKSVKSVSEHKTDSRNKTWFG